MRLLLAAVVLSTFANLPSARAGLVDGVNTALDQSDAPSVHINRLTGEVQFVRLQSPTELTLKSSTGALTLPTGNYPSGVVVDASGLPYQLYWQSEQPFAATFDAGKVFVPELMGANVLSYSSFDYAPGPLSHFTNWPEAPSFRLPTGKGGVAVVVPEPAGLCLAIGGFAIFAARARRVFEAMTYLRRSGGSLTRGC